MLRGIAADAAWRGRALTGRPGAASAPRRSPRAGRSAVRVVVVTAGVLLVPLVGMQVSDGVSWSPGDFVFAGVLMATTGALLELVVRRPRAMALRLAAVAIAVGAILLGAADDAPGLVLFGLVVIAATVVLAVRTAWRGG
jgi:uncharacterized membrane protein